MPKSTPKSASQAPPKTSPKALPKSLPKALSKSSPSEAPSTPAAPRHWLLKSEPDVFSIDDLARAPKRTTHWDGVRNYQARNTLRDDMKLGDLVLFYHSNAKPPGIAGIAKVVREGYPDHTAWDPKDDHFDPKSDPNRPTWMMVDIQLVEKFPREVTLPELRDMPALANMVLLRKGSRLSVQPVSPNEYAAIVAVARR